MPERLLLVDDEPHVLSSLGRLLRRGLGSGAGDSAPRYQFETFTDPKAALRRAAEVPFALALVDYRMPGMSGVDLLDALRQLQPDCARVILSGYADLNGLIGAINRAGIARFFAKPWNDHELLSGLSQALQVRALDLENRRLADLVRQQSGLLSAQEAELRRLEALEPGITRVEWGPDGSVQMDAELADSKFGALPPGVPG